MKIQKVISNVRLQLSIPGIQGKFLDKVTPDIDRFTDKPVIQCNIQVVENTFVDVSKKIKMINRYK